MPKNSEAISDVNTLIPLPTSLKRKKTLCMQLSRNCYQIDMEYMEWICSIHRSKQSTIWWKTIAKQEKQIKICIIEEMKKCIIITCLFVHCDKNAKIDDKFAKCIIINISI